MTIDKLMRACIWVVAIVAAASGYAQSPTGGIQEQINALPQPSGGVVTVSANVAMTTNINLNNKQNITLLCINNATISVPPGSNIQVISAGNFSNIVVSGCTINGPGANYPSSLPPALWFFGGSNLTIDHNTINGGAFDGIYINHVTVASVHHNTSTNNGANGIECDASYCLIYSNTATNNGFMGVEVYAPGNHSVVSNNTAQFNGQNGINLQSDPKDGNVNHIVVANNTSTDNVSNGIQVGGIPAYPIDHVVVTGNTVLRNQNVGVNLSSAIGPIISDNVIQDNNFNHFYWAGGINCNGVTNAVIMQNTVGNISSSGKQQWGIKFNDTASTGNLIVNNSLSGNLNGPFYSASPSQTTAVTPGTNILINSQ